MLEKAKQQARKAGGNALLITDHNPPTTFGSTCHRISATIIRIKNPESFAVEAKDNVIPDKNIALLHIYRPAGFGPLIGYDVYLDNSIICRAKNKWKETVSIREVGRNTIWTRTEAKVELPMDLECRKRILYPMWNGDGGYGRPSHASTRRHTNWKGGI